jgi:hypothetical protein
VAIAWGEVNHGVPHTMTFMLSLRHDEIFCTHVSLSTQERGMTQVCCGWLHKSTGVRLDVCLIVLASATTVFYCLLLSLTVDLD